MLAMNGASVMLWRSFVPDNLVPRVDVTQHLRLCHKVAHMFRSFTGKGIDYEDLFQAAFEGVHFAACRFDPAKGKFSTIALPMARFSVMKMIRESRTAVREPQKKVNTVHEFSLDRPAQRPGDADAYEAQTGLGPSSLAANLVDGAEDADVAIDRGRRDRALAWAVRKLPPRPRRVIRLRLEGYTLAKIGKEMGVSSERARQLEVRALAALRVALEKYKGIQ